MTKVIRIMHAPGKVLMQYKNVFHKKVQVPHTPSSDNQFNNTVHIGADLFMPRLSLYVIALWNVWI